MIDTNVFISAAIKANTPPERAVEGWRAQRFELVTSRPLLDELEQVMERPRIRQLTGYTPEREQELLASLNRLAIVVSPDESLAVVSDDPSDDRVLEAAVAGEADYVVSGDRHLLELGSFRGIGIVTPARFLEILAEMEPPTER